MEPSTEEIPLLRVSRFFGRQNTPYLTRIHLPSRYKLQVFHRGDEDPDPHDHPWGFWTFPLTSYCEEVWYREDPSDPSSPLLSRVNTVQAFRWHYRPAEYIHRVLRRKSPGFFLGEKMVTIMRPEPPRRKWGFWPRHEGRRGLKWVHWREYLSSPSGSVS